MILLVDNYDSFVYNLQRYLVRLGQQVAVLRNDQLDLEDSAIANYDAIVISPGPRSPDQAGVCLELIRRFYEHVPMLGICLGHQAIWQALGGCIVRAQMPIHGRASQVRFADSKLFTGLENPFSAARYHSLVADPATQPRGLRVTAWSDTREIMALEHERLPVFGMQFHPESILTRSGFQLLRNFLMAAEVANVPDVLPPSDLLDNASLAPLAETAIPAAEDNEEADPFAVFPGSDWR